MFASCSRRSTCSSTRLQSRFAHKAVWNVTRWPGWQVVIGIEVHAQIKSRAKLFSYSWTSTYDEPHNTHFNAYDAAFPGTLPKLNSICVELAARTAIAMGSQIQHRSAFDRKHYFYADLPSGYQITQHYAPLAKGGSLRLGSSGKVVKIKQIQLEQDTAKSINDYGSRSSFVDLNRAGSALMEIVSEPDIRSPEEASDFVRTLRALLRSIGSSDCNMEEGSLRCDANISVNRAGDPFGTRCEIKNLNSLKFLQVALTSEASRQISLLETGHCVVQETRGFDEHSAETFTLRSKEDAPDYRYMPDPNLPPILLDEARIETIRSSMPELHNAALHRLESLGLSTRDASFLLSLDAGRSVGHDGNMQDGALAFFDAVSEGRDAKVTFNWICNVLHSMLAARNQSLADHVVTAAQMQDIIDMLTNGTLTNTSAKILLKHIVEVGVSTSPKQLADGLCLVALAPEIENIDEWCKSAIKSLPTEASLIRSGNHNVLNKLVGHAMRASRGRADAHALRKRIQELIR